MTDRENKICARIFIEILGKLASPLLTGSGEDEFTDMDLLMTENGIPLLSGSTLAGSLRSFMEKKSGVQETDDLFGTSGWGISAEKQRQPEEIEYQSRIFVYDTLLKDAYVTRRDGVRLDEYKTSGEGQKYDMQVVETGAGYRMRLEIVVREMQVQAAGGIKEAIESDLRRVKLCIDGLAWGDITLGARSSRGFGRLEVCEAGYQIFRMDQEKDFYNWLDWNWDIKSAVNLENKWDLKSKNTVYEHRMHCLRIPLKIKNTLLVRQYSASAWGDFPGGRNCLTAGYGQLTLHNGIAVIPGSTWAGAIRSYLAARINEYMGYSGWQKAQEALDFYFGTWNQEIEAEERKHSQLVIGETAIKGGHVQSAARTSIDRFTGGALNGALFDEDFWVKGTVDLEIRWSDDNWKDEEECVLLGLLLWAIYGLQNGLLAVGGETGVGRGIFESAGVVYLDNREFTQQGEYLKAAAEWCRRLKEAEA